MVAGTEAHAEALWDEVAQVIDPLGLRPSVEKSRVCHLDEGFDFLGFRIQRRRKKGTAKMSVYTYPSKKALASIMAKVRALTKKARHHGLADLLGRLNPVLRGWCVFPPRGVESDVRVSRCLHLASGHSMVAQAAQANHVVGALPVVSDRQARQPSGSRRDRHARHHHRRGHPLSVVGEQHPHTMVGHRGNHGSRIAVAVRGTPDALRVAEGGPGKRTRCNRDTATIRPLRAGVGNRKQCTCNCSRFPTASTVRMRRRASHGSAYFNVQGLRYQPYGPNLPHAITAATRNMTDTIATPEASRRRRWRIAASTAKTISPTAAMGVKTEAILVAAGPIRPAAPMTSTAAMDRMLPLETFCIQGYVLTSLSLGCTSLLMPDMTISEARQP